MLQVFILSYFAECEVELSSRARNDVIFYSFGDFKETTKSYLVENVGVGG